MKCFKGLLWACPISLVLWAFLFYAASMIFDLGMFELIDDLGILEKQEQRPRLIDDLGILDREEVKDMAEDQIVKVERHRLEALASCIESCVALCRENTDFSTGQHPSDTLLCAAAAVKGWIEYSSENKMG